MRHYADNWGLRLFASASILAVTLSFFSAPAEALLDDDKTLVEGAKLCTRYLPRHEREYGIPVHLLAAIASAESGRYHHALGLSLPWPWTINVEGKGYFFDTKQEAMAAVQKFQARGFHSIDVGCMQVNLEHHPHAFATLDQAFEPAYNVAYAAQFLKEKFVEEGTWRGATADYHSHIRMYGEPYARLVFDVWGRIINKVAAAREGKPILNVATHYASAHHALALASINHHNRRGVFHMPHMHEISVSSDTSHEKGVLVIRPHHESEPAQQQASLDDTFVSQTTPPSKLSADDPAGAKAGTPTASGAKGQFSPQPHIVRVNGYSTASASPNVTVQSSKSMFVFDN